MGTQPSAASICNAVFEHARKKRRHDPDFFRALKMFALIVSGVEKIKAEWWLIHTYQLKYETESGRLYKVRYSRSVGRYGGYEIVRVHPGPGSREIGAVAEVATFTDAQEFCDDPVAFRRRRSRIRVVA